MTEYSPSSRAKQSWFLGRFWGLVLEHLKQNINFHIHIRPTVGIQMKLRYTIKINNYIDATP